METTKAGALQVGDTIIDPQGRGEFTVESVDHKGRYSYVTWTTGQLSVLHRNITITLAN